MTPLRRAAIPPSRRLTRTVVVAQRQQTIRLRRMLQRDRLNMPQHYPVDSLFCLN
jgi:hypothetical protein